MPAHARNAPTPIRDHRPRFPRSRASAARRCGRRWPGASADGLPGRRTPGGSRSRPGPRPGAGARPPRRGAAAAGAMHDLADLIARARARDPEAGAALADIVARLLSRRAERDSAIVALARLLGPDLSIRRQAEAVARRLRRYRSAPGETSPERVLMSRIAGSGDKLPGAETIRKIIARSESYVGKPKSPPADLSS